MLLMAVVVSDLPHHPCTSRLDTIGYVTLSA